MPHARAPREPSDPISRDWVESRALGYLNRFDATEARLRLVLRRAVARRIPETETAARLQAQQWVDELIARYVDSGLIDDKRFASNLARSLRLRGASAIKVRTRLRGRGVNGDDADEALRTCGVQGDAEPELEAARALVRRRRIGPLRPEPERREHRHKDLGVLARAGFSMSVALSALEMSAEDDELG